MVVIFLMGWTLLGLIIWHEFIHDMDLTPSEKAVMKRPASVMLTSALWPVAAAGLWWRKVK